MQFRRFVTSLTTLASLPTSMGGLGIRRAADLALPAFLSSTHATQEVVFSVLPVGESVIVTQGLFAGGGHWYVEGKIRH